MNDFLKGIAPTLASALLGPLGGVAVAAIGKVLNIDNATTETVAKVFEDGKLTPEQVANIRALEIDFKKHESELGFRYADLEFKNTDSARKMQIETKSVFPALLSSFITIGFFGILGWMLYDDNIANSEPVLIMLGSLGAAFGAVCNFWLGTSHSSQVKNSLISKMTDRV
jgi:hypothetical protein